MGRYLVVIMADFVPVSMVFLDTAEEAVQVVEDTLGCTTNGSCITFRPNGVVVLNTKDYERVLVP